MSVMLLASSTVTLKLQVKVGMIEGLSDASRLAMSALSVE